MADWWTEWKKKNGVVTKPINQKAENPAPAQKAAPQADWWTKLKTQNNYQAAGQAATEQQNAAIQRRQDELARLRAQELAKFGPEPIKPVQLSGQAQVFLDPLEQFKTGKQITTRSFQDRDSVLQGKAAEAAAFGANSAALAGNVTEYAKHLKAYQKAAGNLEKNAEDEARKYDAEQKRMKEQSPESYYRSAYAEGREEAHNDLEWYKKQIDNAIRSGDFKLANDRIEAMVQAPLTQEAREQATKYIDELYDALHATPANVKDTRGMYSVEDVERYRKENEEKYGIPASLALDDADKYNFAVRYAGKINPASLDEQYFYYQYVLGGQESYQTKNAKNAYLYRTENEINRARQNPAASGPQIDSFARSYQAINDLNKMLELLDNVDMGVSADNINIRYLADDLKNYGVKLGEFDDANVLSVVRNALKEQQEKHRIMEAVLRQSGYDPDLIRSRVGYEQTQRQNADAQKSLEVWAKTANGWDKAAATLGAIAEDVYLSPFEYLFDTLPRVASGASERNPNQYVPALGTTRQGDAVKAAIGNEMSGAGRFLYNTAVSGIESAIGGLSFGEAGYLLAMGLRSADAKTNEVLQKGGGRGQAFWSGVASGTIEAASEIFSLQELIKLKDTTGIKQIAKGILTAMGFEASEEIAGGIADAIVDPAILGNLSDKNQAVRAYMNDGMAYDDAAKQAWTDQVLETLEGALSAGLSAGVSGPIYSAAGKVAGWADAHEAKEGGRKAAASMNEEVAQQTLLELAALERSARDSGDTQNAKLIQSYAKGIEDELKARAKSGKTEAAAEDGTPPHPSPAATPSPQGEGLETGDADSSPAAQNDGAENGGKITRATEQAVQAAREKGYTIAVREAETLSDQEIQNLITANEENLAGARQEGNLEAAAMNEGIIQGLREVYEQRMAQSDGLEFTGALRREYGDDADDQNGGTPPHPSPAATPALKDASSPGTAGATAMNSTTVPRTVVSPQGEGLGGRAMLAPTENGGQIARATNGQEGLSYGTERAEAGSGLADGVQRDAGLGTGGQAGSLGEGTEGSVAGGGRAQELAQLKNLIRASESPRTSAKQIGVRGGTNNQNLFVFSEDEQTPRMQTVREDAAANGVTVVFFGGGRLEVRSKDGRIQRADALYQTNRDGSSTMYIRADLAKYTPEQLYKHESFHDAVAKNKGLLLDMVEDLYEKYSEEEISRMVDAYVVATDGIYGDSEDSVRLYLEEILADQYSGMNRGGKEAARAREAVAGTAQRFAGDIENARQNRAGIERRNGPGFRFSAEEEAAMQEEGIAVTSGPSALKKNQDNKSVSHVLAKNISNLEDMKPLAHLSGNEMNDKSKDLYTQIKEWFNSFGNKETREGFGTVLFDDYGVGGVMNHRPLNRAKLVTLMAAREIVKNGKQISYEPNWKGRGYDSFIFAGPVTVGPNNDLIYVAAVVDKQQDNKFYLNECVDSDGNYVRINESSPSSTKTGFTVQDGVTRGLGEPSKDSISQNKSKNNPVQEKNNSREDSGEIDWIGNRDEDMSGKDRVYLQAVKEGRKDEAKWMVDEAAKRAGYTHKGFHQTGADFTSFSTKNEVAGQFDDETPTGIFIKPTDEDIGLTSGKKQMPLYFKADNMLEFADRAAIRDYWKKNVPGYAELAAQLQEKDEELERQYDELDAEWFKLYEETYDSDDQSALDAMDKRQDEFLEEWNKALQPLRRQMKNLVTAYMKESKYDGIHLKYDGKVYGGPKVETYIVFDPEQVKSAEPVTYDDQGNVIPLSERFRADRVGSEEWKNRDIRFSPAEDDGEIDWIGKAQEDEKTDSSTSPRSAQNDSGEDFEMLAREKKLAMAEKVGIDGLKSRIETAESRLRMWKAMEKTGLMARDEKSVKELKSRIEDARETLGIFRDALKKKQEARKAEQADKAAKAERQKKRAEEKKAQRKEAELADNKPRQARKEFWEEALNLFSVPAAKRQALGNILNSFADKMLAKGSVDTEDRAELFRQLYEAGVEVVQAEDYYRNIRETVDNARIYVPESVRAEFGDDWDSFRKRAWGNGVYLTNNQNDRGADSWNAELAEMFEGSFDPEETDARNMLENIVDLAEEGKAEFVSLPEMMRRVQSETGVSVDEQMDDLERKVDHMIDTFAKKADLETRVRTQGAMKLAKERQKNRELAARQVQRKRENDTRNEVMKQLQSLNKMRKRSAPEIQQQIDQIIGNLDTMARSISPEGMENLQALARKYMEAKDDPNFLGNPYVEARLARLSQVQLDDLEISDVIELGRTISALVKSVTEDKRLLTDEREKEISEAAKEVNKEIASSAGSKGGKLREFLGNEHLSPTRELQRIGGWNRGGMMEKLARALEDGGTRRMDYQRQATRIFDGFLADKANQKWLQKAQGKDADWIKVTVPAGITDEGGTVKWDNVSFEITPMMRVGLLMHSRNVDNLRHIETGGIVIPNREYYRKGDLANADAKGTRVKLRPEIVRAIVKDCTPQERTFASLLEKYYDGFSKEKINEVSMLIDGFERAGGDHYYGIKVSRKFLASLPEQIQKNMALESIGSIVNERVHAGNPIILEDASKALTDHIDLISKYYGFTAPIRDFNAVMNYTFHGGMNENGITNPYAGSIKEALQDKWGAGAQKYIDDLLADLQQSSGINETAAQFLAKLRGNLAGASLKFNPAVALSQTASLPGAMQTLGIDGVAASLKPAKVDMDLIEKYSPVLWYRNQGNSTQELGDYMKEKGLEGKLPFFFNWIQKMDAWTIRRLWAGAEYRVSKDTDLAPGSKAEIDAGTDPYYQEVARVFQRAVYDTQPNYSEMQRPAILRSKSDLTKMLTMYKTVPLQYYNMMYEAAGRLKADKARYEQDSSAENKANYAKSRSFAAKTFVGVLGANVVYVVMKAAIKALLGGKDKKYKDEEGDWDAGKIFGSLGKDLVETYAGSVIFGSELLSSVEKLYNAATTGSYSRYGGLEISALGAVEDTLGSIYNLAKELHDQDLTGGLGAIKDLAKQISMDLSAPANNIETYLLGTAKWFAPEWVDRYENFFDEFERADLKGEHGKDLRAALRVLMDNRTDGLKDETIDELMRLWETGQNAAVPSGIPSSVSVDGEDVEIKGEDRSTFRERWGQVVDENLEELIGSDAYKDADDVGKAKLISKLYEYARQQAAAAVTDKQPDSWVTFGQACEDAGIPLTDYLAVASVDKSKLKDMDGEDLDNAIRNRMSFRVGDLDEKTLDELGRLYADSETGVIPADVPTGIGVGGEETKLTPEQRVEWLQAWKRTAGENLEALMASDSYKKADDDGKAKLISALYDVARASASDEVVPGYEPDKWIRTGLGAEERGVPLDEYAAFHVNLSGLKTSEKMDLLKKQHWTNDQKEFIREQTMATDAQLAKYQNLKNAGVRWSDAMDRLGIGASSETSTLTEAQQAQYDKYWNEISGPATQRLLNNSAYKSANKTTQAEYLDRLNDYAAKSAKAKVLSGYDKGKWVECGERLTSAGVKLDDYIVYYQNTSELNNRAKYEALAKTGWTDSQKLIAMEYISSSTYAAGKVGQSYEVPLTSYLEALAKADADQSGNINQDEATAWIDKSSIAWDLKPYLWQMLCYSSKWKNNPYSTTRGEEIWHSLHPDN